MKKTVMWVLSLLLAVACTPKTPEDVNAAQARDLMQNEDVVVLDVRTDEEWNEGHLEGATHLDFYRDDFEEELVKLPKDKEYVVYCHAGGRSAKAVAKMKNAGFSKVHNLEGGIGSWREEGNKTVK